MNLIDAVGSGFPFRRIWADWLCSDEVGTWAENMDDLDNLIKLRNEDILALDWSVLLCKKCNFTTNSILEVICFKDGIPNCNWSKGTKSGRISSGVNIQEIPLITDVDIPIGEYKLIDSDGRVVQNAFLTESEKCCCGAESIGSNTHSSWCPRKDSK